MVGVDIAGLQEDNKDSIWVFGAGVAVLGFEFGEISLSPASQKRDPAKPCSFVPAVSERSLRSSKKKRLVTGLTVLRHKCSH